MYRLLVVDDEPIIAEGLYEEFQNITHLELDVYKAFSGEEALELLDRYRMDIVVTDIRMPEIDGMQLLERIHGSWPECRVIFLTGFRDFDYAYNALKFDGVKYILKTEGYGKVIEAVEKAVMEIEEVLKARDLVEKANQRLKESASFVQKEYLAALLNGADSSIRAEQQEFDSLGIPLKVAKPFLMLMGRLDKPPEARSYFEKTKIFYAVRMIMEQHLAPVTCSVCLVDQQDNMVWFIQPGKLRNEEGEGRTSGIQGWDEAIYIISGTLETIQASCREALQTTVSFAYITRPCEWMDVSKTFEALRFMMDFRIGSGIEMILTDRNIDKQRPEDAVDENRHAYSSFANLNTNKLEILGTYLTKGERDAFFGLLRNFTSGFHGLKSKHSAWALETYYSIALLLHSYIGRWGLIEKIPFKIGAYKLFRADEHETWTEAAGYLEAIANVIFELQQGEAETRALDIISRIRDYIEGHLNEEISLVKLSELVNFNPSYLSRLFKQLTGENLSSYIQDIKIKRAKLLLERHDIRINDVAEALGFSNTANFARFFRKVTGLPPQEYREALNK